MQDKIVVKVMSPNLPPLSQEVSSVVLVTSDGEIEVMPQHANLCTALASGVCKLKTPSGEFSLFVHKGVADIGPKEVWIITQYWAVLDVVNQADLVQSIAALESATALPALRSHKRKKNEKLELKRSMLSAFETWKK